MNKIDYNKATILINKIEKDNSALSDIESQLDALDGEESIELSVDLHGLKKDHLVRLLNDTERRIQEAKKRHEAAFKAL